MQTQFGTIVYEIIWIKFITKQVSPWLSIRNTHAMFIYYLDLLFIIIYIYYIYYIYYYYLFIIIYYDLLLFIIYYLDVYLLIRLFSFNKIFVVCTCLKVFFSGSH